MTNVLRDWRIKDYFCIVICIALFEKIVEREITKDEVKLLLKKYKRANNIK